MARKTAKPANLFQSGVNWSYPLISNKDYWGSFDTESASMTNMVLQNLYRHRVDAMESCACELLDIE